MSSPARPGITRRSGCTIQLVSAITNWPTWLRNGTRSQSKWRRASCRKTKEVATASTSSSAMRVSTSVLAPHFPPHLLAAPAGRLDRAQETLGELLLLEHVERRLGSAALRGDLL